MIPKLKYRVGYIKYLEAIYSCEQMTPIVITKVAEKYAYAVNQDFINSEDEKETTFKILLENDTAYHCAHPKRVSDSIEQFDSLTKKGY